ncbi:amidase [Oerskovia flava]|uniref:amidase n=1 Tax=Oerskovia flava TaxID=2986422 RepID=UPI002240B51A|nr:amidase [Oerskovia sp. JB1-3-2]
MTDATWTGFDARGLALAVRRGDVSPVEALDATLAAVDALGETVGAFAAVTADLARAQAVAAQDALVAARRSGSLHDLPPFLGVPCPVKDLTMVAGVPLRAGSAAIEVTAPYDDGVVTLLRRAGTIMVGKTSTPELGLPPYTEPDTGPPARTPWDLSRSAGGSSGGAGAAVAAGIVPVAHGSDGGGSLRIPASACGLVGLKPSRGLVSPGPYGVDGPGLASHGVLTRTVRDTAAFLDVLAQPWPGDTFVSGCAGRGPTTYLDACERPPLVRVGLLTAPIIATDAPVDPACRQAALDTAHLLEELGHEVVEIDPPFDAERWSSFAALWSVGALSAEIDPEDEHLLTPLSRWLRARGRDVTGLEHARALTAVQTLTREVAAAWAGVDVVLSPTLAQLPARVGSQREDHDPAADFAAQSAFTPWTSVWNLTGRPAISLPLGEATADGVRLPVGVMLGAAHGQDAVLLALAAQLETAAPWAHRRPPVHATTRLPTGPR